MYQEQPLPNEPDQEDKDNAKKEAEERRLRRLRRFFPFLLVVVLLVYAFTTNFIPSESMEPKLHPGDQILTMRSWLAYLGGRAPSRGDVIIFNLPPEKTRMLETDPEAPPEKEGRKSIGVFRDPPGEVLIKRVIGLPGETVTLKNGVPQIDGKPLTETYEVVPSVIALDQIYVYGGERPVKLGPDEVFVMGDNRKVSQDSRFWGPLKLKDIRGRFVSILFHRSGQAKRPMPKAHGAQQNPLMGWKLRQP